MRDALPQTIHLQDYKVSPFLIDKTDLVFDLGEDHSRVTATLSVRRNPIAMSHPQTWYCMAVKVSICSLCKLMA